MTRQDPAGHPSGGALSLGFPYKGLSMPNTLPERDREAVQQDQHRAAVQSQQTSAFQRAEQSIRLVQGPSLSAAGLFRNATAADSSSVFLTGNLTRAPTSTPGVSIGPPPEPLASFQPPASSGPNASFNPPNASFSSNPPPANATVSAPPQRAERTARTQRARTERDRAAANPNLNRIQNTPTANTPAEREAQVASRTEQRQEAENIVSRARSNGQDTPNNAASNGRPLFEEQGEYQVLYHDFIVYIQGADVTPYIQGSLSITMGVNDTTNQCSFTLANTGDIFTITPENVAGKWRLSPGEPFSEYAKKQIYDFKIDENRNPFDMKSGGRRWDLMQFGCIFHRQDPIRVWVHHPGDEGDFWFPVFTGYLTGKGLSNDYTNLVSSMQITAVDIRDLMRGMRVQRNTVLSGEVREQTELGVLASGQNVAVRRDVATLGRNSPLFQEAVQEIHSAAQARNGQAPLSREEKLQRCNAALLRATRGATGIRLLGDLFRDYIPGETTSYTFAWAGLSFTQISHALTVGGTAAVEHHAVNKNGVNQDPARVQATAGNDSSRGALTESVGRFREGLTYLYPNPTPDRRRTSEDANKAILEHWYRLCLFGSPIRRDCDESNILTRLAPSVALQDCRFWTEAEVRSAGRMTQTDGVWAPDMQLVHWLLPRQGDGTNSTTRVDGTKYQKAGTTRSTTGLFELTVLGNGGNHATNVQREFTDRLSFLLQEVMSVIDYRLWVTGNGDIVFEFPMYDFNPEDFGIFRSVLEVDKHLLQDDHDDEHGEYNTVVLVSGSYTGYNVGGTTNTGSPNLKPPTGIAMSLALAARRGFRIDRGHTYNYIRDKDKLDKIALILLQKQIMEASSFSMSFASRVFITPNRPLHDKHIERIGLATSVTNTWDVFGEATTAVDLIGSRGLDIYGVRRSLTGGRALPISFAEIPGANGADTIRSRRDLSTRVSILFKDGLTADEIVFGRIAGNQLIPRPLTPGAPQPEPRSTSTFHVESLREVQAALSLGHPGGGIFSVEEYRQRLRLGQTVSAAEILNRAVAYEGLGRSDEALNVVGGIQTARDQEQEGANPAPTSEAVEQANAETNANRPPGIQPPFTEENHVEASGVVIVPTVIPRPLASQSQFRRRQPPTDVWEARREDLNPNVYGCVGCSAYTDWARKNNEAIQRAYPRLPQLQREFMMAAALIETNPGNDNGAATGGRRTGTALYNFNFMNVKAFQNAWPGYWYNRPEGAREVAYRSFHSAEEGWTDFYQGIHNSRYATAGALFDAGNEHWIERLYFLGWSDGFQRFLAGQRSSRSRTGITAEQRASLPNDESGGIDRNSAAFQSLRISYYSGYYRSFRANLEIVRSQLRLARRAAACDPLAQATRSDQRRRELENNLHAAQEAAARNPAPQRRR